jgi:hypothetical protein
MIVSFDGRRLTGSDVSREIERVVRLVRLCIDDRYHKVTTSRRDQLRQHTILLVCRHRRRTRHERLDRLADNRRRSGSQILAAN